jgi:hypothetical protein
MNLIIVLSTIALIVPSFGSNPSSIINPITNSFQSPMISQTDEDDSDLISFTLDSTNVRSVGRWPFGIADVVIRANIAGTDYAILGSGGGAYILDMTNPNSPNKIGQLKTPGRVSGLAVVNNYLYIADRIGIRIFDISTPQAPVELGSCPTSSALSIFVKDDYAYLVGGLNLVIVNVTNPYSPQVVSEFITGAIVNDVYVQDSFAYITNSDSGFHVLNVANPNLPQLVGSLVITDNFFDELDVFANYAYLTGIDSDVDSIFLKVIDISNPTIPIEVARKNFSYDFYNQLNDVLYWNNLLYVTTDIDLQIFDVSQPTLPNLVGEWQGNTGKMAVFSVYLFIASGATGLRILDIYDPTSPVLAGVIELSGSPKGIALGEGTNDYAYIASGSAGLRVISTADPYLLQEIGVCTDPNQANDVRVRSTVAYVADGWNGIKAINIINPYDPTLFWEEAIPGYANAIFTLSDKIYVAAGDSGLVILQDSIVLSSVSAQGNAMDVFVVGRYAYVAARDAGLRIIDVNDPYLPVEVGYCDTIDYVSAIFVSGNYAYLVGDNLGMVIVDVSDPSMPYMVSTYETPDYPNKIYLVGQYVFITDQAGNISILDVTEPAFPELVYTLHAFDFDTYDIVVSGNQAYVTDDNYSQFYVFDNVLDFQTPTEISSFSVPDRFLKVDIAGSYAYFANEDDGLIIFDISNPEDPIEFGSFDTPREVMNLAVRDTFAYLGENNGFRIVNVANPATPFEVSYLALPDDANSVFLLGNYAYVACDNRGLRIIDISNPSNPTEIGFFDTGDATDLFVVDTFAYIADGSSGLRILNVTNPNSIYQIGIIDPGRAFAVKVERTYAYVADYAGDRLVVIDVLNPAEPVLLGSCSTPLNPTDLSMSGNYIYVANRNYGMRVIDITDPNAPVEVGIYDTPGRAFGVKALEDLAYVADYTCGFVILEFLGPAVAEKEKIKIRPTLNIMSNPLRPFSIISYSLSQATKVSLNLYDVSGRQIRSIEKGSQREPGKYYFSLRNLTNGIYFIKFETENYRTVKKIVLVD